MRKSVGGMFLAFTSLVLAGCGSETDQGQSASNADGQSAYKAEITYTAYGIPHVTADTYASLGFGEGYVAAKDHLCNISHIVLRAKGELSKTFGRGANDSNFLSDYAVRGIGLLDRYKRGYEQQPDDIKEVLTGYAAGFNKYLSEHQASGETSHWCNGEDWVEPITPLDVFSRVRYIAETLVRVGGALDAAKPPSDETSSVDEATLYAAADALHQEGFGSNAWAIGSELSEGGGGMLLANPHYPWYGSNRFWEKHLTISGEIDAYGVGLVGIPGVLIGFNKDIAWSHTVSNSRRMVLYRLTLSPDDPMSYEYEGDFRQLEAKQFSIPVKDEEGRVIDTPATMYYSLHGPLIALPGLKWDNSTAYAVRDANRDNDFTYAQWFDMGRANSMESFKAAHERFNALPWINTIATSRDGQATYLDNSSVGYLSDTAIASWKAAYPDDEGVKHAYDRLGLLLLDGSQADNNFIEDGSSPLKGTVPFDQRPQITRQDYVFNANDSYWLSSPRAPMTGFSPLYGPAETQRSLRTRQNILHLEDPAARGADGKWSLDEVQGQILSNKSLAASLFLSDVIEICDDDEAFDASVCNALKSYDGYLNIDSKGAVLFREWIFAYNALASKAGQSPFSIPFSSDDPVNTPRGLGDRGLAKSALEAARDLLVSASLPLDAAIGDVQVAQRGDLRIPIHGGGGPEGVANIIYRRPNDTLGPYPEGEDYPTQSNLTDKGYLVTGGTSFIMTLEFTEGGPRAEAFLTYGQSGTPGDANYSDQTQLFSDKNWRAIYFKPEEIKANAKESFVVEGK